MPDSHTSTRPQIPSMNALSRTARPEHPCLEYRKVFFDLVRVPTAALVKETGTLQRLLLIQTQFGSRAAVGSTGGVLRHSLI
jgi:hypothetical protein